MVKLTVLAGAAMAATSAILAGCSADITSKIGPIETPLNDTVCFQDKSGSLHTMDVKTGQIDKAPEDMMLDAVDKRCARDVLGIAFRMAFIQGGLAGAQEHRAYILGQGQKNVRLERQPG